jgi:hypothetical protein
MTSIESLFVDEPPQPQREQRVQSVADEQTRRRRVFINHLVVYYSSFDRSAIRILVEFGVGTVEQALNIVNGRRPASESCVLFYPSTTPIFINRGDKSCVTVNMTTAKLLAIETSSIAEVDESVLRVEFNAIVKNKHKAVLVVLVAMKSLIERSRCSSDDPDYFALNDAEVELLIPAIRFLVEVVKSDRCDDHLVFSVGAHLVTSGPVLALQVGLDVRTTESGGVEPLPGRAEFARLVVDGVLRCHQGWAMTNPFVKVEHLISKSRTRHAPERSRSDALTRSQTYAPEPSRLGSALDDDDDVANEHATVETKRAKFNGRMQSHDAE